MERERCDHCEAGPKGEAGHAGLREHFRSGLADDGSALFSLYRCLACGALWNRTGGGEDVVWRRR